MGNDADAMANDPFAVLPRRVWDDEELFARNFDGQLVRLAPATAEDYEREVTLTVDGEDVTVTRAVPLTDSQGNIVRDRLGRTVPRRTTIHDAATKLLHARRDAGGAPSEHPIPTLCHQDHLAPAGVCRVCTVEVRRTGRDGRVKTDPKLLPACRHPVDPSMAVHTIESPDETARERVRAAVRVLVELLAADHLPRASDAVNPERPADEFQALVERLGADPERFRSKGPPGRRHDPSSALMDVRHDACILCNRCIRACNDLKGNEVIGRAGRGYEARIAFDLDDPMGSSSCVSCGECMVTCPTSALTFRQEVTSEWKRDLVAREGYSAVSPAELREHGLFRDLSYEFLAWNADSVVRWNVKAGDVLCRQGDPGATAFVIISGELGYWTEPVASSRPAPRQDGLLGWLVSKIGGAAATAGPPLLPAGPPDGVRTEEDLIVGELSCLNSQPRTATVRAVGDGRVYVIRRNLLHALQRNRYAREKLDEVYRERALEVHLRQVSFFDHLDDAEREACRSILTDRVELLRAEPGQVIFAQGDEADAFYMVRFGHVKISQIYEGRERVLDYRRPNQYFGELGLVSQDLVEVGRQVPESIWKKRSATCTALDHVELVRIDQTTFEVLIERFAGLRRRFLELARGYLDRYEAPVDDRPLAEFLHQGLFNGQRLLVLDLEACTRCDECTKACADTHGGVTRLVRDGRRFGNHLVASACRSCTDPYCLVGCPVDAIHRRSSRGESGAPSLEIVIENHCIGCGQCAKNCPYGNINMQGFEEADGTIRQKATTCDLCRDVVGDSGREVSCVWACPHHAAFRMTGDELFERVHGTPPPNTLVELLRASGAGG